MESLKPGDRIAPVTAMAVTAVQEVAGVVMRMKYVTESTQTVDDAIASPNFILKSAQARQLGESLLAAANVLDRKTAA